jgi:hypothetical protein
VRGIPDFDEGPADGLLVHLHWLSEKFGDWSHVVGTYFRVWHGRETDGLAFVGGLRLSVGRMPRQYPASYVHVFVGADLDWYTPHSTVGRVGGFAPHWFGYSAGEPWTMRGCFVDDALCNDPLAVGDAILHEVGHNLIGDRWHAVEATPAKVPELRAGAEKARKWANKLIQTGSA